MSETWPRLCRGRARRSIPGMALFGGKKRDRASDWTPVTIHIVTGRRPNTNTDVNGANSVGALLEFATDRGTLYDFVLEVRPPGAQPYQVSHRERVPKSVTNPGLSMEQKVPDGIDRPGWVRVDDPQTVAIDWSGYGASPESKVELADARAADADTKYAQFVLAKQKPKMQEQLRASAWFSVSSLAAVVRDGALTREEWEQTAQSNLRRTLITPEQYAAAVEIAEGRA